MRSARYAGQFFLEGRFRYEVRRADGRLKKSSWLLNGITDAAIEDNEEVYFRSGTQRPNWYAGLISSGGFSALDSGDTMSSHAGWLEWTGYDEAGRPQWSPPAASGRRLLNSSAMTFTQSSPATLQGLFLASSNTKGGTAGLLWCTAPFDSAESLLQGEVLRLYYDLTGATGAG